MYETHLRRCVIADLYPSAELSMKQVIAFKRIGA